MSDAFLDSSVVIGLVFRHAGERAVCRAALPQDARLVCSDYVAFEIARGFLRRLIALHNFSFEYRSLADLHLAARSGQKRFTYEMPTWMGAFEDYFAALEAEDGDTSDVFKLEEFRAKLRGWIRRGWQRIGKDFSTNNEIKCRDDLPSPSLRTDQRLDQHLPSAECGQPAACGLQAFIHSRAAIIESVAARLEALPASRTDKETVARIQGLRYLLATPVGTAFQGDQCYRCGDALICIESPVGHTIVSKNRKHFEPIADVLGKALSVPNPAKTTA